MISNLDNKDIFGETFDGILGLKYRLIRLSWAQTEARGSLKVFRRSEDGSISLFWLILIPAILLVGGFGTDISMINAQKRYVQSQADLAVQSAIGKLPDLASARATAQSVVSANDKYGDISLGSKDVLFGTFDRSSGRFVAAPDQTDPAGVNAVKVVVPSEYSPFLLAPVMTGRNYSITRSGVAARRGAVSFTLRNRLLGVDTSESILDPVLGHYLGLGASAELIGYKGLATSAVKVNQLLGLLSARAGVDALTYDDILKTPIAIDTLIGGLKELGGLPEAVSSSSSDAISLGSLLAISPDALQAGIGQVLPDLKLNAFDLLMAMVSVNGSESSSALVDIPVALSLPSLASVKLGLSLIEPAVSVVGFIDDDPPLQARLSQLKVTLSTDVAGLLQLGLDVQGAGATATALTLNCGASEGSDTLATFDVKTEALNLTLTAKLLQLINGKTIESSTPISILGNEQTVSIQKDQLGKAVPIPNDLHLNTVTSALSGLLTQLRDSTQNEKPNCGLLGLGCLVGSLLRTVFDLVTSIVNDLNNLLANLGALDAIVNSLLGALGISVAQADLILNDYSCSGALVQ
jgi:uncharacterized membrane protein